VSDPKPKEMTPGDIEALSWSRADTVPRLIESHESLRSELSTLTEEARNLSRRLVERTEELGADIVARKAAEAERALYKVHFCSAHQWSVEARPLEIEAGKDYCVMCAHGESLKGAREAVKLRAAITAAGFAVMETSGAWSIHDVREDAKKWRERDVLMIDHNLDLERENERLKGEVADGWCALASFGLVTLNSDGEIGQGIAELGYAFRAQISTLKGEYETSHASRLHAEAVVERQQSEISTLKALVRRIAELEDEELSTRSTPYDGYSNGYTDGSRATFRHVAAIAKSALGDEKPATSEMQRETLKGFAAKVPERLEAIRASERITAEDLAITFGPVPDTPSSSTTPCRCPIIATATGACVDLPFSQKCTCGCWRHDEPKWRPAPPETCKRIVSRFVPLDEQQANGGMTRSDECRRLVPCPEHGETAR
jgi:hypothetical protein